MTNKFPFYALGAMLLAGSLTAESASRPVTERQKISAGRQMPAGEIIHKGKTFRLGSPEQNAKLKVRREGVPVGDIIDIPTGKAQEYSKASGGYYAFSSVTPYMDYGQAATIYWDGDEAFIYNILSYKETDSYVYGERSGNTLIVPMNQTVADAGDYGVNVGLLKTVLTQVDNPDWEEGDDDDYKYTIYINFVYSDDFPEATYTIGEDGLLTLVLPELPEDSTYPDDGFTHIDPSVYGFPAYSLGFYYTDDLEWTGDCDIYQEYAEFNYEPVVVPENLEYRYYSYVNSYDMGVLVNIAKEDDTLYIKGLSAYAPDAVVTGKIEKLNDRTVVGIPQFQYIGKTQDGYYNLLTRTVRYDSSIRDYALAPDDVDAYFFLETDAEGNITSLSSDKSVNFLVFNYADDMYDPYDEFPDITLSYQSTLEGTPQTPQGAYFEDHTSWLGAYYLFFYLSQFSEEGTILDVNELYYRVFVDGEPYVFEQHNGENLSGEFSTMYAGVTTPTTLIPYTFYNGYDLFSDEYHLFYVGFYQHGIRTIGVQAVYTYGDKEVYSELVTLDVSKVEEIPADAVSMEYYDLNGLRVANPDRGLYIVRTVMADGSVKVSKIVR